MNGPLLMGIIFLVTMAIGVPIPFAAGLAAIAGVYIIDMPMTLLAQSAYTAFESFPLVTIPLFVLAGQLMERGGMSNHLINISKSLVGSFRGGMGMVTVVACMFFAALSGSGPATTAAIGSITIPGMIKEGYKPRFAGAIAAAGGALGSMIPPSNLLIIYALSSDQSIPRLFLAGIVPGIFLTLLLLLVTFVLSVKYKFGGSDSAFSLGLLLRALWAGKWAIGAPIVILGGIYSGLFTPTEAAAVAVFYGLFVGLFIYKELSWKGMYESLKFTAVVIGTVLFILGSSKAFGQMVTLYDIPEQISTIFAIFESRTWMVLLVIGIIYIIAGMWIETVPQVIIFTAVFFPYVQALGIDPILFGVFTVMTCEVGFLTPPIGVNLFVASRISNTTIEDVSVGVIPFLLPYIGIIILMAFYGGWVTFLPDLFYGTQL
ncbi:TRAP transporter large permease [Desulfofustis glycolicus]|uniref:C4-dicarboxylate transporter, DctM subunit n=1 Tax=Desulfofustis glycolicus DSM 9705 TaxID=1121409 RepID=A0A1M5WZS8_9BACT|nr:TRAP transporter large permease [Desulfofustis glycolicus]MCB2214533.1 TRAP transporter large permease [Desulfobulbaceae bacterium]SHH92403.1 C4-dicarboxylate transporter, DctM subunit [Desulfofustis glycolicus DSM 9705]